MKLSEIKIIKSEEIHIPTSNSLIMTKKVLILKKPFYKNSVTFLYEVKSIFGHHAMMGWADPWCKTIRVEVYTWSHCK